MNIRSILLSMVASNVSRVLLSLLLFCWQQAALIQARRLDSSFQRRSPIFTLGFGHELPIAMLAHYRLGAVNAADESLGHSAMHCHSLVLITLRKDFAMLSQVGQ